MTASGSIDKIRLGSGVPADKIKISRNLERRSTPSAILQLVPNLLLIVHPWAIARTRKPLYIHPESLDASYKLRGSLTMTETGHHHRPTLKQVSDLVDPGTLKG